MTAPIKPRLTSPAFTLFYRIVAYVRENQATYLANPSLLSWAAGDVMDGIHDAYSHAAKELLAKGIIGCNMDRAWDPRRNWYLTPYGTKVIWWHPLEVSRG